MMVTGASQVYAVFGDPVAHSLSPVLHNAWFADHAIDAAYVALRLSGEAEAALRQLPQWGFAGANVTVPHKGAALAAADRADEAARRIGAANTLRVAPDGALEAFNTDAEGFLDGVRQDRPDWSPAGKHVVLIGAGGAARAIVDAAARAGAAHIRVANRTPARAEALADLAVGARFEAGGLACIGRFVEGADLIVQAGAAGLSGGAAPLPEFRAAAPGAIAVDIVYRPLDGLGMLVHQAARAFVVWRGVSPDVSLGRARLRAHLETGK
jgi:shikimate dehydrogenase